MQFLGSAREAEVPPGAPPRPSCTAVKSLGRALAES